MSNTIKLLCLNVSLFDENNDKLKKFLQEVNPDILCLQEVTQKIEEFAKDTFISKDAIDSATPDLLNGFFAPNWSLTSFRQENFHGKDIFSYDFGGAIAFGNYFKTRYQLLSARSVFVQGEDRYIADWEDFIKKHPGQEPRNAIIADIQIDGQKIRVITYHGIWSRDKKGTARTEDASKLLLKLSEEVDYPTILCGDFNLFPDTPSIQIIQQKLKSLVDAYHITHTRPASNDLHTAERNVVDYVFVSPEIHVKNFRVIDSDVSDHFPLLVEIEI